MDMKKILTAGLSIMLFNAVGAQTSSQEIIKINQEGYYTTAPKIAVITVDYKTDDYADKSFAGFYVIKSNTSDTVFKNTLGRVKKSSNSSLTTRVADFSAIKEPGVYTIYIPGIGNSYPFAIDANIHTEAAKAGLKGFYFMRVSMPLEAPFAGKWSRPAGHKDTEVLIHPSAASAKRTSGTVISSPGGWYDAGDYNKYIVNSGITMGTILSAYEDFSVYFDTLNTAIPESNNGVPDILDEALYNLRWMLTMQDPNDGGVYHKLTNASFDGMVMPGVTTLPRFAVQKGTAATLDFAAVMAQGSRIFKKYNAELPGLADSCLKAATNAWKWAVKNPAVVYDQNELNKQFEPKVTTGAYGDKEFKDEWFWAATELMVTTGKKEYYPIVSKYVADVATLPSWANVQMMGIYTLNRFKNVLPSFAKGTINVVEKSIINLSDQYISRIDSNAFNTVMGGSKSDFVWGSSSVACNQGILLLNAYFISKDKKYIDAALTNLDYILGRNATGYSFLTGIGSKPVMRPHHRPSIADTILDPVPGLLSGGPNPGMQDGCFYVFKEPETAFSDTDCSYASNEIAINWNAPFVYLANGIEALQQLVGY